MADPAAATPVSPVLLRWATVVAAGAAAAVYGPVVGGILRQWYDEPATSHGVLLAAAAGVVVARRWRDLRDFTLEPRNAGFLLLTLALCAFTLGTLAGDLFTRRLSLPLALLACTLTLGGARHARAVMPAFGLLVLAIPLPNAVVTYLTLPLQLVSSQVAAGMLTAASVEVTRQGNLLALPGITLEVADACSGLRSVVSLVSIAAVCAALVPLSGRRTLFLMSAAVPIAILGNGLRVAATGVMTTWIGEAAVRGTLHDVTGYAAFIVMCAAILLLQVVTRTRSRTPAAAAVQEVHA